MKASEYIIELQRLIDEHGDLPLYYYQDGQLDFFETCKPAIVRKSPSDNVSSLPETAFISSNEDDYFKDMEDW